MDNYEVLKNNNDLPLDDNIKSYYGNAIQNQVTNFYNMYNYEDDVLEEKIGTLEWYEPHYYPFYEGDDIAMIYQICSIHLYALSAELEIII